MAEGYWNHNVHYHPLVLGAVPEGCGAALDIGCGDGLLARRLAGRSDAVVGVDIATEMVRLARERGTGLDNVTFAEADFLYPDHEPLGDGRFDFVSAVAVIHHVGFGAALAAVERLLSPGGRAVIIGLARSRTPLDWTLGAAGIPAAYWHRRRNGGKGHPESMPVKDPAMSWGEIRRDAQRLLPGCRFRRHLLWRYSLTWDKPRGT